MMGTTTHAIQFAPPATVNGKINLVGLSRPEIITALKDYSLPGFRAKKLWHWIYHHGVIHFEQMNKSLEHKKA